jgi:hypothetical protein
MNQLTNDQLRRVLRIWARAGLIERYQAPMVPEGLKCVLTWLIIGAFCGFVWGVLVAKVIF